MAQLNNTNINGVLSVSGDIVANGKILQDSSGNIDIPVTKVKNNNKALNDSTSYNILFKSEDDIVNDSFLYLYSGSATSKYFCIGNNSSIKGGITLQCGNGKHTDLIPSVNTETQSITLPDASGTVILDSTLPSNTEYSAIGTDASYPVLYKPTTSSTTTAGKPGFDTSFYYNPSSDTLTAGIFNGSLSAAKLTGTNNLPLTVLPTSNVTKGTYGAGDSNSLLYHSGEFTVPRITVDVYGRVTSASTTTYTLPSDSDTHYEACIYIGEKDTESNAATTNKSTYLKLYEKYENGTQRSQHLIKGSGATTVVSDKDGNITIDSPTADGTGIKLDTTNNKFSHSTGAGYNHIPSGGEKGNFLVSTGISGEATWGVLPSNGKTSDGIVAAGGTDKINKVWKITNDGTPGWEDITAKDYDTELNNDAGETLNYYNARTNVVGLGDSTKKLFNNPNSLFTTQLTMNPLGDLFKKPIKRKE